MRKDNRNLLNRLAEELREVEGIEEADVFTMEELSSPVDIIRCMITEMGTGLVNVLGEFFFLPFDEEEVLYFSSVITIDDEIPEDERADLEIAVARINYVLPCGCFAVGGEEQALVYKYTVPIPDKLDDELKCEMLLTAVDSAIATVDAYLGYLLLVQDGNITPAEMIELIQSDEDEEADAD